MKVYKLVGREPVACGIFEAVEAWGADEHVLAQTRLGDILVSTIFLMLDHGHHRREGPPVLFETMIFGGKYDHRQWRYTTFEIALEGHNAAVDMIRGKVKA